MSARRWGARGQAAVLTLGLVLVAFSVAGIAVDGTRAFVLRRSLQNAADAAALAGAGEIDRDAYYASNGRRVALEPQSARRVAASWLAARGFEGKFEIASRADALSITLQDFVRTTFLALVGISRLPVSAEARAEPLARSARPG